ncbi:MAG TPA: DUF3667 domain-containing protein [Candidatus Krumholzibacterium sp.]|nr:DUF3667 domain-containing protein [Candidatus Krumholzibacterium sp.]
MVKNNGDRDRSFFREFVADAFDLDHGLFKTFFMLFRDPRQVVDAYRNAEIQNYYSPFKYVVITTTILTFVFFLAFDFEDMLQESMKSASSAMGAGGAQSEAVEKIASDATTVFNRLSRQYATLSMLFLLMPSFATISFLSFRKKMGRYSDHFALSAYFVGQINSIQLLLCLPMFILLRAGMDAKSFLYLFDLSALAYMSYGFLQVFRVRVFSGVLRALLAPVFIYVLFILLMLVISISATFMM